MSGVERFGLVVSWLVLIESCFGLAFLELPDRGHRFTVVVVACISALTSFLLTKRWLDFRPAKKPAPAASDNAEKQVYKYKRRGLLAVDE